MKEEEGMEDQWSVMALTLFVVCCSLIESLSSTLDISTRKKIKLASNITNQKISGFKKTIKMKLKLWDIIITIKKKEHT